MSSQNSRKRPAPGATPILPVVPAVPAGLNAGAQQDPVMQWASGLSDPTSFNDLSRNANGFMMGAPGQFVQQTLQQQPQQQQQQQQPPQMPLQAAQPQQLRLQPQPMAPQPAQAQSTSTAIARRPPNRALIPSAPRPNFDLNMDLWPGFVEDAGAVTGNPAPATGGTTGGLPGENESIEVLEERAQRVKKDAQAKRKQIPPFVQKLSR